MKIKIVCCENCGADAPCPKNRKKALCESCGGGYESVPSWENDKLYKQHLDSIIEDESAIEDNK